jgi:hypothetical protein
LIPEPDTSNVEGVGGNGGAWFGERTVPSSLYFILFYFILFYFYFYFYFYYGAGCSIT